MKINLYDFDNTIYKGDSSVDFFLFILKKKPYLFYQVFIMLFALICYKFHIMSQTKMKELVFGYLKRLSNVDMLVKEFWLTHEKNIKDFYKKTKHDNDVIISASPEFLLTPICKKLKVKLLIGTKMDKKTGKVDGLNCHDEEKVRRLNEIYKEYSVEESYSDSKADIPILNLAKKAYFVKGDKLFKVDFKY